MRVPNLQRSPSFMQGIGLVLCGVVFGAAVMTGVAQRTVQELQYDIDRLEKENKSLFDQVANYEKVKNRRNVIDRTAVRWDPEQKDLGKATHAELEDRIGADLLKLIGQPVHSDMYTLYRELINGKVYYNVGDKDYRIRLTMLSVVGTECIVFVRAEEFLPE